MVCMIHSTIAAFFNLFFCLFQQDCHKFIEAMGKIENRLDNFLSNFERLYEKITETMEEWESFITVMDVIKVDLHEVRKSELFDVYPKPYHLPIRCRIRRQLRMQYVQKIIQHHRKLNIVRARRRRHVRIHVVRARRPVRMTVYSPLSLRVN